MVAGMGYEAPTRPISPGAVHVDRRPRLSQRDLRTNVQHMLDDARSIGIDTSAIERRMATFDQLWEAYEELESMLYSAW